MSTECNCKVCDGCMQKIQAEQRKLGYENNQRILKETLENAEKQGIVVNVKETLIDDSVTTECRNITVNMTFGEALRKLKSGGKVCRKGWNGKGMFLYLERFPHIATHENPFEPCIVMWTADKKFQPGWNASTQDVLANDWQDF